MTYNLRVQAEVLLKIQGTFDWYEEQSEGLGHDFLEKIRFCYLNIMRYPEHYSYINELYRRIKLERFPYFLIYEIDGDDVIVMKLRHNRQKPI